MRCAFVVFSLRSWATVWGDQGYIMMTRNSNNQCGIASKAIYPTGVGN